MTIGIHQILTGLTYGDAISHHSLSMRAILRDFGFRSLIFAEQIGEEFSDEVFILKDIFDKIEKNDLIIFHYSIFSKAIEYVRKLSNKIILVYHNITPIHFFSPYSSYYSELLDKGRLELSSFHDRTVYSLADSTFNLKELLEYGYKESEVFPIIFKRSFYRQASNPVVSSIFNDDYLNILSVSRIVPQKRLENTIKAFALYRRAINNKARLIIVGEYRGFEKYLASLLRLRDKLKLGEVYFMGLVPFNELLSYYKAADILISTSEHEGFCVPLLEGMHFHLPILAHNCGAITETLGSAGIFFDDFDAALVAELINYMVNSENLKKMLGKNCEIELKRFELSKSIAKLDRILGKIL